MTSLALKITDCKYDYGIFKLKENEAKKIEETNSERSRACFKTKKRKKIHLDNVFINYLVKELLISEFYRVQFVRKWTSNENTALVLILRPTKYNLIDYEWNERVYDMVRERCELDHALSWLSTLGGAFSALGDYFPNCAEIAGKISINQFKLALRLGDPSIAARCRLYFSLSLIQKKRYRYAKMIVHREYHLAKKRSIVDSRLLNMCRGIWSKLQYEHGLYRKHKNLHMKMKALVI